MPRLISDIAELPLSQIAWANAKIEAVPTLELEILALFDSLRAPLLRYSISFGLSVTDGEDVIQETFLALFDLQSVRLASGTLETVDACLICSES